MMSVLTARETSKLNHKVEINNETSRSKKSENSFTNAQIRGPDNIMHILILNRWDDIFTDYTRYFDHKANTISYLKRIQQRCADIKYSLQTKKAAMGLSKRRQHSHRIQNALEKPS